ncbi:MAG: hypothetical protein JST61_03780 [Acidobacteria bacterium]|nr:hypothetical protein [Acidobacteriota bacterium]
MKIGSADVRSLLMRLCDEIQGGTDRPAAAPMSFAQSLGESLMVGGKPAFGKTSTDTGDSAAVPTNEPDTNALPLANGGIDTSAPMCEAKTPRSRMGANIELLPQHEQAQAKDPSAIAASDTPGEKGESTASTLLEKQESKTESAKNKTEHKWEGNKGGEMSTASSEPKVVVVDPAAQSIHAAVATTDAPVVPPLGQTVTRNELELVDESPTAVQGVRVRSNRSKQSPAVQAGKAAIVMQDGRRSKGTVANSNKTDNDAGQSQTVSASISQQSSVASVTEKPLSKAEDAGVGIHAVNSELAAPLVPQSGATHTPTDAKVTPPSEALPHTILNGNTAEISQPTIQEHRVLSATPSTIEVGVAGGSHGWLKIRAEMTDAGTVKASLASASTTGQEILHRDLPLLSNYLEQERIPVSSLAVQQAVPSPGVGTTLSDGGGGAGSSQGESSGSRSQSQGSGNSSEVFVPEGLLDLRLDDPTIVGGTGGSWLNVRA